MHRPRGVLRPRDEANTNQLSRVNTKWPTTFSQGSLLSYSSLLNERGERNLETKSNGQLLTAVMIRGREEGYIVFSKWLISVSFIGEPLSSGA